MTRARVGVNGRNDVTFGNADYEAVRIARFESLKMLSKTKVDVFQKLHQMNPGIEFIVRLFDDRVGAGHHPTPQEFVNRHLPVINSLKPFVRKFEILNEPNHHERYEGWGSTDADARDFRSWYLEVLRLLRKGAPWAEFGFPGLALNDPHRDIPWLHICKDAVEQSDWLGVHCYWQYDQMTSTEWGMRFVLYHNLFPNKALEITEFGDATPNVSVDKLASEYVKYYQITWNYDYVRSANAFILSSPDPTWDTFALVKHGNEISRVVHAIGQMDRPPLTAPKYGVSFLAVQHPSQVHQGDPLTASIRLKNEGTMTWYPNGDHPVRLGSHWINDRKELIMPPQDVRIPLPHEVAPRETVTLQAKAYAPEDPGNYILQWDLVHEGVGWFSQKGAHTYNAKVKVTGVPRPKERFFTETGHWVRGAFLQFFEEYGLDICGYPITDEIVEDDLPTQYFQKLVLQQYGPGKIRLKLAGADLLELKRKLDSVETVLYSYQPIPMPSVQDITSTLPARRDEFLKRKPGEIKYLVIHHSGVSPEVGPEEIAKAHIKRWPGIMYHYFIAQDGTIYQTNPLEEIVDDKPWFREGIQVCFAGDFSKSIPTEKQILSGAKLLASLIQKYKLAPNSIVGIGELAPTSSPGRQWLEGKRWKSALEAAVIRLLAEAVEPTAKVISDLQQSINRLRNRISELKEENRKLKISLPGHVQEPRTVDLTSSLPRASDKFYARRRLSDIRYIVILHTATTHDISAKLAAESHIKRGYPGIIYHYMIHPDGTIDKTNPLESVADPGHIWSMEGVVISFVGKFDDTIPTDRQIKAGGQLCAYLLQQLGLDENAIKGLQEMAEASPPGKQWLAGKKWKGLLLESVNEAIEEAKHAAPQPSPEYSLELEKARQKIKELQSQLQKAAYTELQLQRRIEYLENIIKNTPSTGGDEAIKEKLLDLQKERDQLESQLRDAESTIGELKDEIANLQKEVEELQKQVKESTTTIKPPHIVDVVDKLEKNPDKHYDTRPLSQITHISVHHSATPANISLDLIAKYHVETHGWPGIGYHFYIKPDGTIYQTNRLETVSYHTRNNNSYTVGICVAGTFNETLPTPAQMNSAAHLIAWLMEKLNIPLEHVKGHKEYVSTQCPGEEWLKDKRWKALLLEKIKAVQEGLWPVPKVMDHYVLFWSREKEWAKNDWIKSVNYIGAFKPSAGFKVEDAMASKKVLIVGGPSGVTEDDERRLIDAGCKVERIAGATEEETIKLLDKLAEEGKPFSSA